MLEDLRKEIRKLAEQKPISIPIETDKKGYIDKQCPNEHCEFLFKINASDWSEISKNKAVWCPFCRHEAPADHWHSIEHAKHGNREAVKVLGARARNALKNAERDMNRKQNHNSFVSVSMKVSGDYLSEHAIPAKAANEMQLEIQCEKCESQFAVIGSAYFCPACGYNSVERTFSDSLRKISAKVDNLSIVRQALTEASGEDVAELTCRSLMETSISDGVVAFQRYCECKYEIFGTAPFNAFQRLAQGSKLWKKVVNEGYDSWITPVELSKLMLLFQKRHLLAHSDGIVDSKYIEKTGETSYKIGQRIVVVERDIIDLVSIIEKLTGKINEACTKA